MSDLSIFFLFFVKLDIELPESPECSVMPISLVTLSRGYGYYRLRGDWSLSNSSPDSSSYFYLFLGVAFSPVGIAAC